MKRPYYRLPIGFAAVLMTAWLLSSCGGSTPTNETTPSSPKAVPAVELSDQQALDTLLSKVPNDVRNLMVLHTQKSDLTAYDEVTLYLEIDHGAKGLISNIHTMGSGGLAIGAEEEHHPVCLLSGPSSFALSAWLWLPGGTAALREKATNKIGDVPVVEKEMGWNQYILSDHMLLLSTGDDATAILTALSSGNTGKPKVIREPANPDGPAMAVVYATPDNEYNEYTHAAESIVISKSETGSLDFRISLFSEEGVEVANANPMLERAYYATEPWAKALYANFPEPITEGNTLRYSLSIAPETLRELSR